MTPNIDTLIMHHKQASKDFLRIVKIYSVTVSDMLIIFHIPWGSMVVSYSSY